MKVLVACEFSGRVRDAFNILGHEAASCDLLPSETPGRHYRGDVRDIINDGWDMMIAFPPCTYLARAGLHHTTRGLRDPALTEQAIDFVRLLLNAPIAKIAVENPAGLLSTVIRKPDQIIHPYEYGDDACKTTCMWYKNLPLLVPSTRVEPRMVCCGEVVVGTCGICNGEKKALPRWANQSNAGYSNVPGKKDRWKIKSRTYPGIARAMAEQWGNNSMMGWSG